MEGTEAETFESESEVLRWWSLGDLEDKAEDVEWPEVVILHRFPKELGSNGLAVVHPGFIGVFANDAIDDDDLLTTKDVN
jgi:hypothetical protein